MVKMFVNSLREMMISHERTTYGSADNKRAVLTCVTVKMQAGSGLTADLLSDLQAGRAP